MHNALPLAFRARGDRQTSTLLLSDQTLLIVLDTRLSRESTM